MESALQAVEQIDESLGVLEKSVIESGGQMLITADHGNIENMYDTKPTKLILLIL